VVLFFETRRLKVSDVWPWFRFSSVLSLLPSGMKEALCGGGGGLWVEVEVSAEKVARRRVEAD
jgi:Fe-S oxidoreductase